MADGKWIPDLRPDMPLPDTARRVLSVRLQVVRHFLPLAVHEADRDPEYVHQLRVGTRRAAAALRIFRDCLPGKLHKAVRNTLRRVRRAAGAARDWDVFLIDLLARQKKKQAKEKAGSDFLVGYSVSQRIAAQAELEMVGANQGPELDRLAEEAIAAVRAPTEDGQVVPLVGLARPMLVALLKALEEAAGKDLTDYALLHQVRIAGKRLRYAMEVFADCFAADFRDKLYPMVEEMQEILGRANDSHVAIGRLTALRDRLRRGWAEEWSRLRPGMEGMLRFHQRRLPQERRRFLKWWDRWIKVGSEGLLVS
jgi:CHAD domain-containing protein